MRRLRSVEKIFDNSFQSQFELYDDGKLINLVTYRLHDEQIRFILYTSHGEANDRFRDSLCSQAILDAYHRKLNVSVISRTMASVVRANPRLLPPKGSQLISEKIIPAAS